MKNLFCCFLLFVSFFISSQQPPIPPNGLDKVINFGISIKSLDEAVQKKNLDKYASDKRYILLDGMITSLQILDKEEVTFQANLELVSGEWEGVSDVKLYKCLIKVHPQFANLFLKKDDANEAIITVNKRIIVLGKIIGLGTDSKKHEIAVINAEVIKVIN